MQRNKFLYEVAQDLYGRFGKQNELSKVTVVTPSKRTKLFLNRYFFELSDKKPLWSPIYTNTLHLLAENSDLQLCDENVQRISLVWDLYQAYKTVRTKHAVDEMENFADFYFFGEILLHDFDDIDKNLVNAEQIFKNIAEFKKMEDLSFLSEEQKEAIERFFNVDTTSLLQKNFFNIWGILYDVYVEFKEILTNKKQAYDGMLMRNEGMKERELPLEERVYAFVGFHNITKIEEVLFENLKQKSLFYWDYDNYFLTLDESTNAKTYLKKFPDARKNTVNSVSSDNILVPNIEIIDAPNAASQTGYIKEWLGRNNFDDVSAENADTAIVLCDEKILPLVLNEIPPEIIPNVAILYTLMQSKIATEVLKLGEKLLNEYKSKDAQNSGIFLSSLRDFVSEKGDRGEITDPLEVVALSEIYKILTKLLDVADKINKNDVIFKLLKRLLFSGKISFSGEPAKGLQIMAMSDTRNMDFKNILLLSANDGIMPKIEPEVSFIPPFLRRAFGLPTIEDDSANAGYNFYRLIHRAENIALMYSSGKNATGKGEMSRYLLQLLYEHPHKDRIVKKSLNSGILSLPENKEIIIQKTPEMLKKLAERYNGNVIANGKEQSSEQSGKNALSPSAFNMYIDCPLQFYFRYVKGLKKPDELELNQAYLGSIFHRVMECLYGEEMKKCNNEEIEQTIIAAFHSEYFTKINQKPKEKQDFTGEEIIYFNVVKRMVENTLKYDESYGEFDILGLEKPLYSQFKVMDLNITVGGIVDRIDKKNDKIRVLDYKTAAVPKDMDYDKEMSKIFDEDRKKKSGYLLQTFLYATMLSESSNIASNLPQNYAIVPVLFFPLAANDEDYSPLIRFNGNEISNFAPYKAEFLVFFNKKMEELFDISRPFSQCKNKKSCEYCDYKGICGKGN
ncbi:hypothetical protein FACS1894180_2880 [Bacteroidia bacterium]|nr:hypothetical protein FACS1894180_2880 [Bacteroidia bacterium]